MTRLAKILHLDEAPLTRPVEMPTRYPAPNLALDPHVRSVLEAARLGCVPGTSRVVIDEICAADAPVSLRYPAPVRIRPEALLTASAATVHTLAVAYDDLADEVETALAELTALIPLAVAL